MTEENGRERRVHERRLVKQLLRVSEFNSSHMLGNMVNLSHEGFMLISTKPVTENEVSRLTMELPYEVEGASNVTFEARCMWCQKSSYSDDYGAGFQIESMADSDKRKIEVLFGGL
jgi:hypothetical protein